MFNNNNKKKVKELEEEKRKLKEEKYYLSIELKKIKSQLESTNKEYSNDVERLSACIQKYEDKQTSVHKELARRNKVIEESIIKELLDRLTSMFKAERYIEIIENKSRVEDLIRSSEQYKKLEYPQSVRRPRLFADKFLEVVGNNTVSFTGETMDNNFGNIFTIKDRVYNIEEVNKVGYTVKDRAQEIIILLSNKVDDLREGE